MKSKLSLIALLGAVFSQVAAVAQVSIEVLRPNSSDRLLPGSTFTVEWRAQGSRTNTDWSFEFFATSFNPRYFVPHDEPVYDGNGLWHVTILVPTHNPPGCDYVVLVSDDIADVIETSEAFCLGPAQLSVSRLGAASVQITWATNFADHILEYATRLPAPGWSTVTNSVVTIGDQHIVTVDADAAQRFYRLRKP